MKIFLARWPAHLAVYSTVLMVGTATAPGWYPVRETFPEAPSQSSLQSIIAAEQAFYRTNHAFSTSLADLKPLGPIHGPWVYSIVGLRENGKALAVAEAWSDTRVLALDTEGRLHRSDLIPLKVMPGWLPAPGGAVAAPEVLADPAVRDGDTVERESERSAIATALMAPVEEESATPSVQEEGPERLPGVTSPTNTQPQLAPPTVPDSPPEGTPDPEEGE